MSGGRLFQSLAVQEKNEYIHEKGKMNLCLKEGLCHGGE